MFSYYGSKSKVVNLYPSPKFGKIIEPFAGSARYSLKYFDRDVLLVDKYQVIVDLWHYLQQASESDILKLPKMRKGDDIRKYGLSEGETLLLSFLAGHGVANPQYIVSQFADYDNGNHGVYSRISKNLNKIRHWQIICADYQSIENQEACWFIDPPYKEGGQYYKFNDIDYHVLGDWCKSRNGQVIVCENTKADWLPFYPMRQIQGARSTMTTEAIWSNYRHNFQAVQSSMFEPRHLTPREPDKGDSSALQALSTLGAGSALGDLL